jgi:hypothetical protein
MAGRRIILRRFRFNVRYRADGDRALSSRFRFVSQVFRFEIVNPPA